MSFASMAEIRRANRDAGHHWFEAGTVDFFRSVVESGPIAGRYFVTSEQNEHSDGTREPRLFTVRRANDSGSISTVGEFQAHATLAEALAAAHQAAEDEA